MEAFERLCNMTLGLGRFSIVPQLTVLSLLSSLIEKKF